MKGLGAVNAINLDGGGSTTMVVDGTVVNSPTDGRERPIADSLLVYSDDATEGANGSDVPITDSPIVLHAGDTLPLFNSPLLGPNSDPENILWGTLDGLGFVSQRGVFSGTHAGSGSVLAHSKGALVSFPVTILPADPSVIHASMAPIVDFPPYYTQVSVTVTDRFGNPVPGIKVNAELSGGKLDNPLTTGANGQAIGQIVWDVAPEKRVVKLSALTLKPLLVKSTSSPGKAVISQDPDDR